MTVINLNEIEGKVWHARLGPSSAKRWMNCHGSTRLAELLKPSDRYDDGNEAAAQGTAAHYVASEALKSGQDAFFMGGTTIQVEGFEFEVDQEMMAGVQLYLDYVRKFQKMHPTGILSVEKQLRAPLVPDNGGTADATIEVPGERIIIVDFKFGAGIVVEPTDEQLKNYGQLVIENSDLHWKDDVVVELHIVQPRIPHSKGLCRRHIMTVRELREWYYEKLAPAAAASRDPNAPLTMGPWCRYCAVARANACPALINEALTFEANKPVEALADDELNEVLKKADVLEPFFQSARERAFTRAMAGAKFDDYKLVKKRATRAWKDGAEEEAKQKFGDAVYSKPMFLSPAQIEKAVPEGKMFAKEWCFTPDTGLTLAKRIDNRPEAKPALVALAEQNTLHNNDMAAEIPS